jgi:nucleoside-diphosphate-sugar epimerase
MIRVLVTGATGFIGRAVVRALKQGGFEVHGVARTPEDDVEVDAWHIADLLDSSSIGSLTRQASATHLLHAAWTAVHGEFWADPANLAWTRATCELVEAFAEAGGDRAVMVGSCAQYDWDATALGPSGVAVESATPRRPASLYGSAKQATTELLEAWSREVGLSYANALLFFPYGPHDHPGRLVPSVIRTLLAGEEALVSAGTQVRDFIHVEDCGSALAALVAGEVGGAVNVGSGHGSSVAEVATAVARILDREELLRIGALAGGEEGSAPKVVADIARLRHEVGFAPRYDLQAGLRETIDWWRRRQSANASQIAARRGGE